MSGEEHVQDLLPGYALGILDDQDYQQAAVHLVNCEACRDELRAYQQVMNELPQAAALREPPAGLKTRLLDEAGRRRPPKPAPLLEKELPLRQRILEMLRRTAPLWALASVVLLILLVASSLWLPGRGKQAVQPNGLPNIALVGTSNAPGATGVLVLSRNGADGTLVVDGLKPLDQDHMYQLWLKRTNVITSGGLFNVDPNGYGYLDVVSPEPLDSYTTFGITIEPASGSPAPTGAKVLGGNK